MRHEKFVASNLVMWPMPDLPAKRLAQASATVLPTGLMQPRPVTTTRRRLMRSNLILIARCAQKGLALLVGVGVVDGVLHRRDLFSVFIGDFDAEFIFQGHHHFD